MGLEITVADKICSFRVLQTSKKLIVLVDCDISNFMTELHIIFFPVFLEKFLKFVQQVFTVCTNTKICHQLNVAILRVSLLFFVDVIQKQCFEQVHKQICIISSHRANH